MDLSDALENGAEGVEVAAGSKPADAEKGQIARALSRSAGSGQHVVAKMQESSDRAGRGYQVMAKPPVAIYRAPMCQGVLASRRPAIKPPYEKWNDELLAEEIAHSYSESTLKRAGVNFWTMDGVVLIEALEKMLTSGDKPR